MSSDSIASFQKRFSYLLFVLASLYLHTVSSQCAASNENAQDAAGLDLQRSWYAVNDGETAVLPCPAGFWTATLSEGVRGIRNVCSGTSFGGPIDNCTACPEGCARCSSNNWIDCEECSPSYGTRDWSNNTYECHLLDCQTDFFDQPTNQISGLHCGEFYKKAPNPSSLTCENDDPNSCQVSDCCVSATFADKTSNLRSESYVGILLALLLLFMGTWSFLRQHGVFKIFACSCCPRMVRSLMEAPPKKPDSLKLNDY